MSLESEFLIKDGVLLQYSGSHTDVVVPEGVISIAEYSFKNCLNLKSVSLPEGVTSIGEGAFRYRSNLEKIVLPMSLSEIGRNAFSGCKSLKSITIPDGVSVINTECFEGCTSLQFVTLPKNLTCIERGAFLGCRSLQHVVFPDGLTSICSTAFSDCILLDSIILPKTVDYIGELAFARCKGLKEFAITSWKVEMDRSAFFECEPIPKFIVEPGWGETEEVLPTWIMFATNVSSKDAGWVLVFQPKTWRSFIDTHILNNTVEAEAITAEAILATKQASKPLSKSAIDRIFAFLQDYQAKICENTRKALVDAVSENSPKIAKKYDWAQVLNEDANDAEDAMEQFVLSNSTHTDLFPVAMKVASANIPYLDGSGCASKTVVAALLSEYIDLWDKAKTVVKATMTMTEILSDVSNLSPSAFGDEIASKLEGSVLSEYLLKLVARPDYRKWLLCFCRHATEKDMDAFIRTLSDKSAKEELKKDISSIAVAMSDTKAAMLFADKVGTLDQYAKYRGTNASELRAKSVTNLGFDSDGTKQFDLGGTTVIVSIEKDFSLGLFDTKQNKVLKSMPKKGNDTALVATASNELTELKKKVRQVAKNRSNVLFDEFLSGYKTDGEQWLKIHAENTVFRIMAELIVWSQENTTFTMKDGSAISADGMEYEVSGAPICVAHPIEMKPEKVEKWRTYFTRNRLKQPFSQIWESAIKPETVREDRYAGCTVPIKFFRGAEKHGLYFYDNNFHDDVGVTTIAGCKLEVKRTPLMRHQLLPDEMFVLGKFSFSNYTRRVNHLINTLDRWTMLRRIMNDDVSIADFLPVFSLAQIMEFIHQAQEYNAVKVLAVLLDYKEKTYSDIDPFAELSLDLS